MLQEFNSENTPSFRSSGNFLYVDKKGKFTITASTVVHLGFKPGDKVSLLQDQDHRKDRDWFLTKSEKGFAISSVNKESKTLTFFANTLASKLKTSLGAPMTESLKIPLGNEWYEEQGHTVVALLTKSLHKHFIKAA